MQRAVWTKMVVALAGSLGLAGCGGFASEGQLRMKAAAEFDCDKDSLTVRDAENGVRVVRGCGQEQRYVYKDEARTWLHEDDAGGKVIEAKPVGAAGADTSSPASP